MNENRAKKKLQAGKAVLVTFLNFHNAALAEFLGEIGFDVIIMDGEHNAISDVIIEEFAHVCNAVGVVPMLRLPSTKTFLLLMQRYFSMGIVGYHSTRTQSQAEARQIVDALKYPPIGSRGIGAGRATKYSMLERGVTGWSEYMPKANNETLIKIMIESKEALAAVPEIVKMPEVDVIGIGRNDLAADMGFAGQPRHPAVEAEIEKAVATIKAAGKPFNTSSNNTPDAIRASYARGERWMVTQATRLLRTGTAPLTDVLKELQ